jgi:hypothetical protein
VRVFRLPGLKTWERVFAAMAEELGRVALQRPEAPA